MSWITKWYAHDGVASAHVMPVDDEREHTDSPDCWCKPTDDEGVWVHHSADHREFREEHGVN